jgi:uncharacterized protein YecE (DUF72 family)
MLPFYAEHFSVVEIDATYYRIPPEATFASMAARTPPEFRFTAKVPGTLTHQRGAGGAGALEDAKIFRAALEPLVAAGKLSAVLAQFPYSCRATPQAGESVRSLREALADLPFVAEFRNHDWQNAATLELLEQIDAAWCNVDEPRFERLLSPSSDVVGALAYVRFHGRNAKQWWTGSSDERYDFLYQAEELEPWADRITDMAATAKQTLVFFNNHRNGQAPKNALMLAKMLLARNAPR